MADTIIDNINSIIRTKSELKTILNESGQNPSDTFSEYPDMFRSAISEAASSGVNEDIVNAYISAYLSTYNYIDQNTLSYNSYITLADIPSIDFSSYVTYSYAYETYPTYSYADNKYFGRLAGISGSSDGNVISSIGESFDAGASVRGLYFQKTYVPSYAYIESYYTSKSELSNAGYLTSIPSEYITDSELSACGYLTQHQDLSSYASKSYVADYVATYAPVPDLSSYVSKTELSNAGYLTSIPSEYITDSELSACGYLTQHQDISNLVSYTSNSSFNTIVNLQGTSKISGEDGLTIDAGLDFIYLDSDVYVSANLITNDILPLTNTYKLGSSSGQWAYTYTKNLILNGTNIESIFGNYYTDTQVDSEISASLAYYYTKTQINNASYTSKSQVNGMFSYDSTTGVLTITTIS